MKIIFTAIVTLLVVFALSFLLDLQIIKNNWLRYGTVVLLVLGIIALGFKLIVAQINIKKENN